MPILWEMRSDSPTRKTTTNTPTGWEISNVKVILLLGRESRQEFYLSMYSFLHSYLSMTSELVVVVVAVVVVVVVVVYWPLGSKHIYIS